jgi:ribosome maturation factor RimP
LVQNKKDLITSLAAQTALRCGFEIYDIIVQFRKGFTRVDIRIDNGNIVSHSDCSGYSREFSRDLEEQGLDSDVVVEVSSPGLKRKIRNREEWIRFVEAPVKVTYMVDDSFSTVKGFLSEVSEESVVVTEDKKAYVIRFDTIKHANLDY